MDFTISFRWKLKHKGFSGPEAKHGRNGQDEPLTHVHEGVRSFSCSLSPLMVSSHTDHITTMKCSSAAAPWCPNS